MQSPTAVVTGLTVNATNAYPWPYLFQRVLQQWYERLRGKLDSDYLGHRLCVLQREPRQ